jgi:hypothetical protein
VTEDVAVAKRAYAQSAAGTDMPWERCLDESRAGKPPGTDARIYSVGPGVAPSFHAAAFLEEIDDPGRKVLDIALPGGAQPLALSWMWTKADSWVSENCPWLQLPLEPVRGPFCVQPAQRLSGETFGLYRLPGRDAAQEMCRSKHSDSWSPAEFTIISPEADPAGIEECCERSRTENESHWADFYTWCRWMDLRWTLRLLEVADWVCRFNAGCACDVRASLFCARDPELVARVANRLRGEDWRQEHLLALY